jgi:hypothetical protein
VKRKIWGRHLFTDPDRSVGAIADLGFGTAIYIELPTVVEKIGDVVPLVLFRRHSRLLWAAYAARVSKRRRKVGAVPTFSDQVLHARTTQKSSNRTGAVDRIVKGLNKKFPDLPYPIKILTLNMFMNETHCRWGLWIASWSYLYWFGVGIIDGRSDTMWRNAGVLYAVVFCVANIVLFLMRDPPKPRSLLPAVIVLGIIPTLLYTRDPSVSKVLGLAMMWSPVLAANSARLNPRGK